MAQCNDRLGAGPHLAIDVADVRLGTKRTQHRRFVRRPVLLNIEAGAKAAASSAQDDDANLLAIGESAEIGAQFVDHPLVQRVQSLGAVKGRNLDLPARFDQQFAAHNVCPSSTVITLPVIPCAASEQSSSNGA